MADIEPQQPEDQAGSASAEEGIVVLDGPDGVAVSMEPDTAEETGHRLIDAAVKARGQAGADPA